MARRIMLSWNWEVAEGLGAASIIHDSVRAIPIVGMQVLGVRAVCKEVVAGPDPYVELVYVAGSEVGGGTPAQFAEVQFSAGSTWDFVSITSGFPFSEVPAGTLFGLRNSTNSAFGALAKDFSVQLILEPPDDIFPFSWHWNDWGFGATGDLLDSTRSVPADMDVLGASMSYAYAADDQTELPTVKFAYANPGAVPSTQIVQSNVDTDGGDWVHKYVTAGLDTDLLWAGTLLGVSDESDPAAGLVKQAEQSLWCRRR